MIVVGYIYNNNGMATWCIESAFAIHESGKDVLLIHHPSVQIGDEYPFKTMAFELSPQEFKGFRILRPFWLLKQILSASGTGFSSKVLTALKQKGVSVELFLLNQSDLVSESIDIPQYVCSWAHPLSLRHYIRSTGYAIKTYLNLKDVFLRTASAIGYFYKDRRAFLIADKVLSVSDDMHKNLLDKKFNSVLVSPCINMPINVQNHTYKPVRFLIVALDLECKRKNIGWLLRTINTIKGQTLHLTLVGNYGKETELMVRHSHHDIKLCGPVSRAELLEIYKKSDVFLFASKSEDWGYVILEAMSSGLAVVAPDIYPFRNIIENHSCLYKPLDNQGFVKKILKLNNNDSFLKSIKVFSLDRVRSKFSREVFVSALLQ